MGARKFGLIADTHGNLHPRVFEIFAGVETILHAGDVVRVEQLDELEALAPTFAVQGNCDEPSPRLPPLRRLKMPFGVTILTHGHLHRGVVRDPSNLASQFEAPKPRLIVFGHTHIAYCENCDGIWVVNPGPAGKPRFRDEPSVTMLTWDEESDTLEFQRIPLDWNSGA